tara:strand:+ start:897 stop:1184 length:288 start_codon:yes stop_codon:yes gene_type:complete
MISKTKDSDIQYWATIAWDAYMDKDGKVWEHSEGEYIFSRYKLSHLIESIEDYLEKWAGRGAYLSLASSQSHNTQEDLTDLINSKLQKQKNKEDK